MYEALKPCPHRKVDESGRILCGWIKSGDRQVSVNLCNSCPVPQINCEHLRAALNKTTPTPITVRYATGRVEVWDQRPPSVEFKQAACAVKAMPIHSPRDCAGCPLRVPQVIPQNAIQVARHVRSRPVQRAETETSITYAAAPRSTSADSVAMPNLPAAESAAAQEMVRRAQQLSAQSRARREIDNSHGAADSAATYGAQPENQGGRAGHGQKKSKVILLQQWLSAQMGKSRQRPAPISPQPDEDGISEIVYSPITPAYEEQPGLERCVGWTD